MLRPSPWFIWLVLAIWIASNTGPAQQPKLRILTDLTESGPLSHALIYARRADDQFHVSKIAVHYAKLGDFEQALRLNESATEEDWRTGAFSEIALEYWKQGQPGKAHELFIRVASLPLPKDTIYIWGDVIEEMAHAELFDLALDTNAAMAAAGGSTAGAELATVVEIFIEAKKRNPKLPDILPRALAMARTVPEFGNEVVKKVAVAYAAQGEYDRAIKLVGRFDEDFDRDDGAHELAMQLAKHGLYERAVQLANEAGEYFDRMALVGIASEALKRKDKKKALEITARIDSQISKAIKAEDYQLTETDVTRITELVSLYSQLDHQKRATELADVAFKIARDLGKPGERYRSLQRVANTFSELEFYDKAVAATNALNDHDRMQFDSLAEVAVHAVRKGKKDEVEKIIKTIQSTRLNEDEYLRVRALVAIASAGIEQGRVAEAQELLSNIMPLVEKLESNEHTPEILKNFAVTFAKAGNVRTAIQQIPRINQPFHITEALIEIGLLCATKKLTLSEADVALLDELAIGDLPTGIEPERLVNDAGWEIPGLANAQTRRPPELQKTRDRSIQLYFTYYEPQVETFIKRPFPSRRKPKREEENWISQGLKVSLIEERVINGRKYCYRLNVYEVFQDKETGLPRYTNQLETLFYFDEDGDGKFETLEEGLSYFGRGYVPKWVFAK